MIEPFSNGLVTSRDPSLLGEGELQQTDDCTYRPYDQSLHSIKGREHLGTPAAAGKGIAYCAFDAIDDKLLYTTASGLYEMALDDGAILPVSTTTPGDSLIAINHEDDYILLDGVNKRVYRGDQELRPHGLNPATEKLSLAVTASGGNGNLTAGTYEYWYTEVVKTDDYEIESTYNNHPSVVLIENSTSYVTITFPSLVNLETTHFRFYRSEIRDLPTVELFPIGFSIADNVPITESPFVDGKTTIQATKSPDTNTTITNVPTLTTPENAYTSNSAYATCTFATSAEIKGNIYSGFTFDSIVSGDYINNIKVTIEGVTGARTLNAYNQPIYHGWKNLISVSGDGGNTWSAKHTLEFLGTQYAYRQFKSAEGLFGKLWTTDELSEANFRVKVEAQATWYTGLPQFGPTQIDCIYVDIGLGSKLTQDVQFPCVLLDSGGGYGRNYPPPIATTGDILENALLLNNVDHPNQAFYSTAGYPDYFCPDVYWLKFTTDEKDIIRCIKTLGGVGVVGTGTSIHRVQTLPRESDGTMERERAVELISKQRGIAGPKCATVFQMEGQPLTMACVDKQGLHMTDGYRDYELCPDINFYKLAEISRVSYFELINDPAEFRLILFYTPLGGTTNTKALYLHYGGTHIKSGKLKACGPYSVNHVAATTGSPDEGARHVYVINGVGVYIEDQQDANDDTLVINPTITTREMFLDGFGQEWKLDKALIHHQNTKQNVVRVNTTLIKTNASPRVSLDTKEFYTVARGMSRIPLSIRGEALSLKFSCSNPSTPIQLDYIQMDPTNMGEEDSGK
jgi:hypothetical protein